MREITDGHIAHIQVGHVAHLLLLRRFAQLRLGVFALLSAQAQEQQVRNVANLNMGDMAISNFTQVLLLGLVLAIPAGIFLRE